jgi:hypothetical protein
MNPPGPPVEQFRPQEVHVKPGGRTWLTGRVAKHPRLVGAGCIGACALLAGVNFAILESQREYYPQLLVLTPVLGTLGLWFAIIGQPLDASGKPPKWWRVGAIAACVAGGIVGVVLCVYVAA